MLRKIIQIDEDKCDGCAECIPSCHEGALQIIDGKCRLVSDLFCDGLGACVGECTKGALTVIEAEAEPYSEIAVINTLLEKPPSVMQAHLSHLVEHGADEFFNQAVEYLSTLGITIKLNKKENKSGSESGCPGSTMQELKQYKPVKTKTSDSDQGESMLGHWPIQLHLVNPNSPFLRNRDLVILASCVPVAYADTHREYLAGKAVVIACPKLDYTDPYPKKIEEIINSAKPTNVTIVRMEVPCCSGITAIALKGVSQIIDIHKISISEHIISTQGKKINEKAIFSN